MHVALLVVHLLVAISLVGVILIQRSEGGALGIGGGGGGFMSGRGAANLLTRTTAILAGIFILTSLSLVIMARQTDRPASILDAPAMSAPVAPAAPVGPSVPLSQ